MNKALDYVGWLKNHCPDKVVNARQALSNVKSGSRVFIGTGCGEPQHLIRTMIHDPELADVHVYQMLSGTFAEYADDESIFRRFSLKLFYISKAMRKAAFEGRIDYVPAYFSQIPKLFSNRRIGLDVSLIQVSPPDQYGYCSLGISVDITRSGVENSKLVIAQVNSKMPRTWGDSVVHVDDIDYLVLHDEPLREIPQYMPDPEIANRIGYYVSLLVEDGATLQIGIGHLPYAILPYLGGKKDLGLHTPLITDGFLPLFEKKVITNKKKTLIPGRVVTSMCSGSEKLYRFVDDNPMFYFRGSDFVNDPAVIARNDNLISITSALEVDLTGQVCSDSFGYRFYSGIGDQVDFLRGCAMSKNGFSIVILPSMTLDGTASRIVSHLSEGAGISSTRGDVNFVVTEYGIAELQGNSLYQRVMELAQIAHPKFREELIEFAKTRHYIFPDQLPPHQDDLLFLERYRSAFELKDGKVLAIRPILPSDEFAFRDFFYSLRQETIFSRFFYHKRLFPYQAAQEHWAAVDYRKNISVIGLTSRAGHKEIMAVASYAASENGMAEVAMVIREDFQGKGLGSYFLEVLEKIAKENSYKGFNAAVLKTNLPMIRVFTKRYPNAQIIKDPGGLLTIIMPFDGATKDRKSSD
ncbi:MAG: GNAT family N-acetyltransferase [Syntrophobacteraceae bacterium]